MRLSCKSSIYCILIIMYIVGLYDFWIFWIFWKKKSNLGKIFRKQKLNFKNLLSSFRSFASQTQVIQVSTSKVKKILNFDGSLCWNQLWKYLMFFLSFFFLRDSNQRRQYSLWELYTKLANFTNLRIPITLGKFASFV